MKQPQPQTEPVSGVVALGKLIRLHDGPRPRVTPRGVEYSRICPDCQARHWMPRGAPSERCPPCIEAWREQQEALRRAEVVAAAVASIPERYRWAHLDAPELPERLARPESLAQARDALRAPVVLLTGQTGAGKTSLGVALLRAHLERATVAGAPPEARSWGARALWAHAKRISLARREAPLGSEPALLVRAREASVLLVDDLGQEAPADQGDVVSLLAERQESQRPLIVTCGWGVSGMLERYSPHLVRRLVDGAVVIDLGGA
jgi:hypothetical protein